MAVWIKWLTLACFSWILWMDHTVYTLADGQPQTSVSAEGARSQWQQLAVLPSKAACDALRRERVQQAAQQDAKPHRGVTYPQRERFFCSPVVDDSGK